MADNTVYCEFCGKAANTKVRTPRKLVHWVHGQGKDVIRCRTHKRTSKLSPLCRTHDPLTGERK
jgi:hypothetical protein